MKAMSMVGLVGLAVMGICAQASMEAGESVSNEGLHGGLRQLLQDGSDSCGGMQHNTDYPSSNTLNQGWHDITKSNEECCELCNRNPQCKSWTRMKRATVHNKRGECWLRDHVPSNSKQCRRCVSGIKKTADEILDECEKKGTSTGAFAYRGACSTLVSKCPPPTALRAKLSDARSSKGPAYEDALSDAVTDARDKTCKTLFKNKCITSGFDRARQKGGGCARILEQGPNPDSSAPDCPDFKTAIGIMETELATLCEGD